MRHQRGKRSSGPGSGFPRAVPSVMRFIKTSVRKWKLPDRWGLGFHINKGDTRKITWPRGDRKYYIYQCSEAEKRRYIPCISCCCKCQMQKCSVCIIYNSEYWIILSTKRECFIITLPNDIQPKKNFKLRRNCF